jgi:hypothetical protein
MTKQNNAASVAVKAEPCLKLAEVDCNAIFGVKCSGDAMAPIRVAATLRHRPDSVGYFSKCVEVSHGE